MFVMEVIKYSCIILGLVGVLGYICWRIANIKSIAGIVTATVLFIVVITVAGVTLCLMEEQNKYTNVSPAVEAEICCPCKGELL